MPKLKKLPEDCTFPQLATVLDAPRFAACLQASWAAAGAGPVEIRGIKLRRVYYKPGRSCRITFAAKMRGPDGNKGEQLYFAKIQAEPKPESTYRRALRAALTTPAFGPAVTLVRELGMVLWAYPNDPNVPGMATLASRDAVMGLVRRDPRRFGLPEAGELVELRLGIGKYVPGQRCGYRYHAGWRGAAGQSEHFFYGKAYPEGQAPAAHAILEQLWHSPACRSGRLRIPRPYALDAERDIVWQEMLPGVSFAKDAGAADLEAWAGRIGTALAAFHATPLELGAGLGLEQELQDLEQSTRKIVRAYPQHAARGELLLRRLQDAVPHLPAVPRAPVHGSFKMSHIFDVHGQAAFIDFDGAGLGDPTYDVGRFLAHLATSGMDSEADARHIEAAAASFRAAYGAVVPWGWPEGRVCWYTAALLLSSQAYKCVKRMAPERVDAILRSAENWFPKA